VRRNDVSGRNNAGIQKKNRLRKISIYKERLQSVLDGMERLTAHLKLFGAYKKDVFK